MLYLFLFWIFAPRDLERRLVEAKMEIALANELNDIKNFVYLFIYLSIFFCYNYFYDSADGFIARGTTRIVEKTL